MVSFVGWQGALFLVVTMTIPVKRLVVRVRCPVPGPPRSESWHGSVCRPIPWWVGRCIGFAVVMAQVRRPVPFRTRKLRPGRGDGTALERVWESSTPPLHMLGLPVEPLTPGRPIFYVPWNSHRICSGNPFFVSFPMLTESRCLLDSIGGNIASTVCEIRSIRSKGSRSLIPVAQP